MMLNVHRNRTAYWGRGEEGEGGMEVEGEEEYKLYLSLHCHYFGGGDSSVVRAPDS